MKKYNRLELHPAAWLRWTVIRRVVMVIILLAVLTPVSYFIAMNYDVNPMHSVGDKLDEFNGVAVFYNGAVNDTFGRTVANDGYNLGPKFQCVEFVKRYYYERFNHKMPDAMGHARDFFLITVPNGQLNKDRMLVQYRNGAGDIPAREDLIVFAPGVFNRYGHVAIVSEVGKDFIEIIQQNPGPFGATREHIPLENYNGVLRVDHGRVLGWLRYDQTVASESLPRAVKK